MKQPDRDVSAIVSVNTHMVGACFFGWAAWVCWPTSPYWWGLGLISILFGVGAASLLVGALRTAIGSWRRRKALAEFMAQGGPQKSARLADDDTLRRAGMVE